MIVGRSRSLDASRARVGDQVLHVTGTDTRGVHLPGRPDDVSARAYGRALCGAVGVVVGTGRHPLEEWNSDDEPCYRITVLVTFPFGTLEYSNTAHLVSAESV